MMRDDPLVLYCKACCYAIIPVGEIPAHCKDCLAKGITKKTSWTTARPYRDPVVAFHNTVDDSAWLKSQNISGED